MSTSTPPCPLVVTGDARLLDELVSIARAAGVRLFSASDTTAARTRYQRAPLVLLGVDAAEGAPRLAYRPDVVLVCRSHAQPEWLTAVAQRAGASYIAVIPEAAQWLTRRLAETRAPRPNATTVAVIGGRGGAGATILAVGLAVTGVRRGERVLLIDADPVGGGADVCLGWERRTGARWPSFSDTSGWVEPDALVQALPHHGRLAVISFDRSSRDPVPVAAMRATLTAGRGAHDLVVVDLPRQLDEAAQAAHATADHTFLVVPAELRACAAARRIADSLRRNGSGLSLVVRGPSPGRLRAQEIADRLDVPLAGALRPEPRLARALERGQAPASWPGPLASLCDELLSRARTAL